MTRCCGNMRPSRVLPLQRRFAPQIAVLRACARALRRRVGTQVVYKGRKKKSILYYAIKSVEKSQKARVLQEVRGTRAPASPQPNRLSHRDGVDSGLPIAPVTSGACPSGSPPSRLRGGHPLTWAPRAGFQVRTLHSLDHKNILKFYAWCARLLAPRCPTTWPVGVPLSCHAPCPEP